MATRSRAFVTRSLLALILAAAALGGAYPAGADERVPAARTPAGGCVSGRPLPTLTPAAGEVYFGVWQPGLPGDFSRLDAFSRTVGRSPAIVMLWRDWAAAGDLNAAWLCAIAARGAVPLISWMPVNWQDGDAHARYGLDRINAGAYDAYVRGWARQLAAYGGPVLLRWAHEMNGDWYPWGQQEPAAYVAAWRRLHAIFRAEGANNVLWVWSPNVSHAPNSDFEPYFPGDQYLDWVGWSGFNFNQYGWYSFEVIFADSHDRARALTDKPQVIAEFASGEALDEQAAAGYSKAEWIRAAFHEALPRRLPNVRALVWFNEDKSTVEPSGLDWRIDSSPEALAAFRDAIAQPYIAVAAP